MGRLILKIVQGMLFGGILIWAADWGALRWKIAHGNGYSTVQVNEFLRSPLKGNKEEYDVVGQEDKPCVRSMLPEPEGTPCWWIQTHRNEWE